MARKKDVAPALWAHDQSFEMSAVLETARAAYLDGRLSDSEQGLRQVLAQYPNNADAQYLLGAIAYRNRDYDMSARMMHRVVALQPRHHDALLTLGNIYRNNQDYVGAGATYERAIDLIAAPQRSHWRVYYYAGIAFERQKQWDKAEKFFRRSLELSPDEAMVLNYLGYSMIEKKINLQEALEMVKKAVELARESLAIAEVSYENGVITATELNDARLSLLQTEWELTQAKYSEIIAAARTRHAAGL